MKRTKKYWNNIAGYLTGEMNHKQIEKFLLKIEDNQQLKNDYKLMKKSWNNYSSNPAEKFLNTEKAWDNLNKRIVQDGMGNEDKPTFKMSYISYIVRIAAVILLIIAVGIPTIYYSANERQKNNSLIEHSCENGTLTIDLPDGTRVFLNEGSNLKYKEDYEEKRDVKLEGEGYFDVMADPQRPFRVNTGKVVLTVLGTSFNIRETNNKTVEVFVESGKVRMDLKKDNESVILTPGQIAEANGHIKTSDLSDENYLSWKTKDFKFIDESVDNILNVLETSYHVNVRSDVKGLNEKRLTTTYSDQSFDAILNTICTALNMHFEKEGKVYILHSN